MNREQLRVIVRTLTTSVADCNKIMNAIDQYAATIPTSDVEGMTAAEIAEYVGLSSPDHARVWCYRKGIKSIGKRPIPGESLTKAPAIYPAPTVRAARNR